MEQKRCLSLPRKGSISSWFLTFCTEGSCCVKSRITIISEFHRTAVHEKLGSAFQSIMSVNLGHMLLKLPHSIRLSVFKKKKTHKHVWSVQDDW